jgi:hypothetical protein
MKFLIQGSMARIESEEAKERFKEACRQLGGALAQGKHTVIIGSDTERTPDPYIVYGANEIPGHHPVTIYRMEDDDRTLFPQRENLKNIDFHIRRNMGPWTIAMLPAIQESDVVILIGGGSGTVGIGYSARALQKPVLPIPSFQGGAKEVWDIASHEFANYGVSPDEIEGLRGPWNRTSADTVVRVAEKLVRRNPFRSSTPQVILLCSVLLLFGLWLALFQRPFGLSNDVTFFLLMGVAAVLGTGFRSASRLLKDATAKLTARELLIDVTVGILLAFGFVLIYLIGGIVITGKLVSLNDKDDYTRVAITMSLIGFAVSALLESAIENLQKRMEKLITP